MNECLFCGISQGKIPSSKIFENDKIYAFLDINPVSYGHTLIIPKFHAETIFDLPLEYSEAVIDALQKIGKAIMKATNAGGVNVLQNNYPDAGQAVPHLHWHIIPRFHDDGLRFWPQKKYGSDEEMNSMANKISQLL